MLHTILSPFHRNLRQLIITLILFTLSFGLYVYAEKEIDRQNELRLQSYLLADELRQSSDDLTRMVRSYIATGNPLFKRHYKEVLDIRNGLRPRPLQYHNVYWDLVGLDDTRPRGLSMEQKSLITKMSEAGFTKAEFAKLNEAKIASDTLSKTEYKAMALFEAFGNDDIQRSNKNKALELLHNSAYRDSKIKIMHPIQEFQEMVQIRTSTAVERAMKIALYLRLVFIVMGVYLFFILWRLILADKERKKIEGELKKNQYHLASIINNEPECVKTVNPRGQLVEMNTAGLVMLEADSLEEAQQCNLIDYLLPEYRADFIALHKKVMSGENSTLEFQIKGLKGSYRWLETHATPLRNSDGEITMLLGITRDITERKANEDRIRYLATYDTLTGLPNRSYLEEYFAATLSFSKRHQNTFAILFLDLDHFKDINDTLGHHIGDNLLIETADRLKSVLREEDMVSRMGGDEFIIMLPNLHLYGIEQVAKKLLSQMNTPFHIYHHELTLSASIGIAIYPNDGDSFEALSKNADTAMYRAKHDGRNNYCFFTDDMQHHSIRNLELTNALRHALERDQLTLHYQPQIDATNHKLIGVEALLRWNHPDFGAISPAEFIPIAEESGLILPIGEWVLKTAMIQAKAWMDKGYEPIIMAINLSAIQFRHLSLPQTISNLLQESQLPSEYLELELTESVAMHDPNKAIEIMNDLHSRGIRLSIDDFGTGYSSLSYLKKFKIYKLKIDQSFIRDIKIDDEDKAIVSAIISMAQRLGLKTIAEGVETIGQLEYLQTQGCDEVQGYYFSKPLDAASLEAYREFAQKNCSVL